MGSREAWSVAHRLGALWDALVSDDELELAMDEPDTAEMVFRMAATLPLDAIMRMTIVDVVAC